MGSLEEEVEVHVRRLRLEPGDILVFTLTDEFMPRVDFEKFAEYVKDVMKEKCPGHECIVLSPGIELSTMKPSEQ